MFGCRQSRQVPGEADGFIEVEGAAGAVDDLGVSGKSAVGVDVAKRSLGQPGETGELGPRDEVAAAADDPRRRRRRIQLEVYPGEQRGLVEVQTAPGSKYRAGMAVVDAVAVPGLCNAAADHCLTHQSRPCDDWPALVHPPFGSRHVIEARADHGEERSLTPGVTGSKLHRHEGFVGSSTGSADCGGALPVERCAR